MLCVFQICRNSTSLKKHKSTHKQPITDIFYSFLPQYQQILLNSPQKQHIFTHFLQISKNL